MTADQALRLLEILLFSLPGTLAAIGALVVSLRTDRRVVTLPATIASAAATTDRKIDAMGADVVARVATGTTIPPPFGERG
jgi:uncharacterized membrane protein YccF (DUF307 family)